MLDMDLSTQYSQCSMDHPSDDENKEGELSSEQKPLGSVNVETGVDECVQSWNPGEEHKCNHGVSDENIEIDDGAVGSGNVCLELFIVLLLDCSLSL